MKAIREILVAFLVGLASLLVLHKIISSLGRKERPYLISEPVPLQGRADDAELRFTWGLDAISASEAWSMERGRKEVTVAIIDTGCDIHHPELRQSLWRNPGEHGLDENGMSRATNGIDDDDNGFVDDAHGWDFVSNSPAIMDEHGHGTHIAGIIGGRSGLAPGVSLMFLKYYDTESDGEANLRNSVHAIRYAVRMGARIINYSGGGILRSAEEAAALEWAARQNVLVVAAAGNEGLNSDFFPFYPADYELPNILSVAATDRKERLLDISNYGLATVDLGAPGKNIYSTLPLGQYGYMTGTSQAAAFVSGVAALLVSRDPRFENPEILIEHILAHSKALPSLRNRTRSGAQVNAMMALSSALENLLEVSEHPGAGNTEKRRLPARETPTPGS
ncbi:MAG: S8 family peptidase [Bdellovibrionales bacterium]